MKSWVEPIALWDTQTLHTLLEKKVKCGSIENSMGSWLNFNEPFMPERFYVRRNASNDCIILSCLILKNNNSSDINYELNS